MTKIARILSLSLLLLLFAACAKKQENPAAFQLMYEHFSTTRNWSSMFISRGGQTYGMDSDSMIEFKPGGRVILTEYGVGIEDYHGLYSIDENGTISMELARHSPWPLMILKKRGDDYFLHRKDDEKFFEIGNRGGAVEIPEMNSFWPFKLVRTLWSSKTANEYLYRYLCPCCGYISLSEQYQTCLICFWEDDISNRHRIGPDYGPNLDLNSDEVLVQGDEFFMLDNPSIENDGLTLRQARENFKEFGASDPELVKFVLPISDRKRYKRENI